MMYPMLMGLGMFLAALVSLVWALSAARNGGDWVALALGVIALLLARQAGQWDGARQILGVLG